MATILKATTAAMHVDIRSRHSHPRESYLTRSSPVSRHTWYHRLPRDSPTSSLWLIRPRSEIYPPCRANRSSKAPPERLTDLPTTIDLPRRATRAMGSTASCSRRLYQRTELGITSQSSKRFCMTLRRRDLPRRCRALALLPLEVGMLTSLGNAASRTGQTLPTIGRTPDRIRAPSRPKPPSFPPIRSTRVLDSHGPRSPRRLPLFSRNPTRALRPI